MKEIVSEEESSDTYGRIRMYQDNYSGSQFLKDYIR